MDHGTTTVVVTAILAGSSLIIGVVSIATKAWQRVVATQTQGSRGNQELAEEIKSLRKEVAQLRDTTTRYDLAFDTALQRLDSRVEHMEKKSIEAQSSESDVVTVRIGSDKQ